jgi:hypothetical protein
MEIYSCWFDDEAKPTTHERRVKTDALASQYFIFAQIGQQTAIPAAKDINAIL